MDTLATAVRLHLCRALTQTNGHILAASKLLGLTRWAMYRKMKKYGITEVDYKETKTNDDDSTAG